MAHPVYHDCKPADGPQTQRKYREAEVKIVINPVATEMPALAAAAAIQFAMALKKAVLMRSHNGANLFRSHGGRLKGGGKQCVGLPPLLLWPTYKLRD